MGRITELLDSFDVSEKKVDLNKLYGIFESVEDIPIQIFFFEPGLGLARVRINKKGELFQNISELSYNPHVSEYGRANLPNNPMFYACASLNGNHGKNVKADNMEPPPRIVAISETSSFCRTIERSGIERSTVAIWESKAKLKLIALPFINSYENPCGFVQMLTEKWIEMQNNSDIDPIGLELVEYMSKEIAADFPSNNDYIKIANFVNYLLNVYDKTKDADGIIYPSVKAEGDGFNVALKTDSFEKKFYFVKASLCYLVKRNDKSSVSTISDASPRSNGRLKYSHTRLNELLIRKYIQYKTELKFVN